ncbi:Cytochrome c oxidase subunit 3 [Rosistilla oblonga]|uniref:Cytochrome c oxidase subunit 3 n=1 Tax=Rosistilla oblonga TaxID=2527990 RepID=A0A518IRX9_9BACT|nr:cytochrome c oxidase subunit 3 [Rosistilla oblonga]QDV11823.1 Cytochrome c oxidase subunit 3 [Rosistilla oblonga]QDV55840.1 Cytochrome c oxidase subunit 3 [Rosistilla oblonga]
MVASTALPADKRAQQGGLLFLASLLVFFITGIISFVLYASWREATFIQSEKLPLSFAWSTLCLVFVSGLLHWAVHCVRHEHCRQSLALLVAALIGSIIFLVVQGVAMWHVAGGYATAGLEAGLAGMMLVLALLHALHVIGGVAALVIVTIRLARGQYDHERMWGISFTAQYWHFLDLVWIVMLFAFWYTSGGFAT